MVNLAWDAIRDLVETLYWSRTSLPSPVAFPHPTSQYVVDLADGILLTMIEKHSRSTSSLSLSYKNIGITHVPHYRAILTAFPNYRRLNACGCWHSNVDLQSSE